MPNQLLQVTASRRAGWPHLSSGVRRQRPLETKLMRIRRPLAVILPAWALMTVACGGGSIGSADTKTDIVGTWTRKHEGKVVQEITFTSDGRYHSANPATGGTKEHGTYSVAADGNSVTFSGTDDATGDRASYTDQVRFKAKDEFDSGRSATNRRGDYTYQRKK